MKNKQFCFRLDEKELETIRIKAAQADMDVSNYLVMCALDKKIVVIEGLKEFIVEIKQIANQLNQQTILANEGETEVIHLAECTQALQDIYGKLFELSGRIC